MAASAAVSPCDQNANVHVVRRVVFLDVRAGHAEVVRARRERLLRVDAFAVERRERNALAIRMNDLGGDGGLRNLPCIITNRPGVNGRAWSAPYMDAEQRDYYYNPNIVRGF